MRLQLLLLPLLLLFHFSVVAQECMCEEEFHFLKTYMEQNHPGLNAKGVDRSNYQKATQALAAEIKRAHPGNDCILYLQEYFTFIKQ